MKTITRGVIESYREKGSKFTGHLFPVQTDKEFEKKLEKIKNRYYDATHHCYACRVNPPEIKEFIRDDGEPAGTAGLPILNRLKSYEAVNCACVVVRYFGGTKLGKSGLINTYGQTAELCLQKVQLQNLTPTQNFKITYPYQEQSQIDRLKNSFDLKELQAEYMERVNLSVACPSEQAPSLAAELKKLNHLGIDTEEQGGGFVILDKGDR